MPDPEEPNRRPSTFHTSSGTTLTQTISLPITGNTDHHQARSSNPRRPQLISAWHSTVDIHGQHDREPVLIPAPSKEHDQVDGEEKEREGEEEMAQARVGRDGVEGDASEVEGEKKLGFRGRIKHFTWTWFTMTMATGGVANVLYAVPLRFPGLYTIGTLFFLLNLALFLFNVAMISLRFYFHPYTFRASLVHPTESLFIPAAVISFGTILINVSQYGVGGSGKEEGGWQPAGPWLAHVMVVLFWVDSGLAVVASCGIYLSMWSTTTFTISKMTPVWIFPAYPLLIIGPHAGILAQKAAVLSMSSDDSTALNPTTALTIVIAGFTLQGVGFMLSTMIYAAFIYRLMTQKLPKESLRPGMFISVGPSGFTVSGVMAMGQALPEIVKKMVAGDKDGTVLWMGDEAVFVARVSRVVANWVGVWLWGLAVWWVLISIGAHLPLSVPRRRPRLHLHHHHIKPHIPPRLLFSMTWYSFVFPNTALATATFSVAAALNHNHALELVGCVMAVLVVVVWCGVFVMMIRAVIKKYILWPQKQEDRDEGGWVGEEMEGQEKGEGRRASLRRRWGSRG